MKLPWGGLGGVSKSGSLKAKQMLGKGGMDVWVCCQETAMAVSRAQTVIAANDITLHHCGQHGPFR